MEKRTRDLISQVPKSSYRHIAGTKELHQIFSKNHIHPYEEFGMNWWLTYIIVDVDNNTHKIQLISKAPGDPRNSVYCWTCKGLCACTIVAMIDYISKQKPLAPACEGCGKLL